MSFITTKFHEILLSGFRGVALTNCFSSIFHFGQISKFKKGVIQREKKMNQNFLWICASTHYVLRSYKVSRNSVERFQRSCADRKNRTDWHQAEASSLVAASFSLVWLSDWRTVDVLHVGQDDYIWVVPKITTTPPAQNETPYHSITARKKVQGNRFINILKIYFLSFF